MEENESALRGPFLSPSFWQGTVRGSPNLVTPSGDVLRQRKRQRHRRQQTRAASSRTRAGEGKGVEEKDDPFSQREVPVRRPPIDALVVGLSPGATTAATRPRPRHHEEEEPQPQTPPSARAKKNPSSKHGSESAHDGTSEEGESPFDQLRPPEWLEVEVLGRAREWLRLLAVSGGEGEEGGGYDESQRTGREEGHSTDSRPSLRQSDSRRLDNSSAGGAESRNTLEALLGRREMEGEPFLLRQIRLRATRYDSTPHLQPTSASRAGLSSHGTWSGEPLQRLECDFSALALSENIHGGTDLKFGDVLADGSRGTGDGGGGGDNKDTKSASASAHPVPGGPVMILSGLNSLQQPWDTTAERSSSTRSSSGGGDGGATTTSSRGAFDGNDDNGGSEGFSSSSFEVCLGAVLFGLASHPAVLHVSPLPAFEFHNARASRLLQSSRRNDASAHGDATPMWDRGLNGQGQILGMADSGLDTASCYFSSDVYEGTNCDDSSKCSSSGGDCCAPMEVGEAATCHNGFVPFRTIDGCSGFSEGWYECCASTSGTPPVARGSTSHHHTDLSQPKVVQYIAYVDGQDDYTESHGTHVVGSAVGAVGSGWGELAGGSSSTCADSQYYCMLPDTYSDCDEQLSLCPTAFADGGSLEFGCAASCYCSNGGEFWGTGPTEGDGQSCAEFLQDNKALAFEARVAFFDIGEYDGRFNGPTDLNAVLFSPAYAAGARVHSNSWGSSTHTYGVFDLQVDTYAYAHPLMTIIFSAGNEGSYGHDQTVHSPGQAKNALTVGASASGRWPTDPQLDANPSFVAYFSGSGPTSDGRIKPDLVAPGYWTVSALSNGYEAVCVQPEPCKHVLLSSSHRSHRSHRSVAVQLSQVSSCAAFAAGGTSQSTSQVAAAALLVRQYLTSSPVFVRHLKALASDLSLQECIPGYPGCVGGGPFLSDDDEATQTSALGGGVFQAAGQGGGGAMSLSGGAAGALVKAMLIHATVPQTAWDAGSQASPARVSLNSPPDHRQGFGRLDLSLILLDSNSTTTASSSSSSFSASQPLLTPLNGQGLALWCTDAGSVASGETAVFFVRLVSDAQPLTVTLAWYDPPNTVGASKQLLNDLDLKVKDITSGTTWRGNGEASADRLNTVEKVEVAVPPTPEGSYRITVSARTFPSAGSQDFALVVTAAGYVVWASQLGASSSWASHLVWRRRCKARHKDLGCARTALVVAAGADA